MNWIFYFLLLIFVISALGSILYFFQESFIFINREKLEKNHQYHFPNKFKEIFIRANGENEINALHFELPNPKGIILFCHGNKGNLTRWGNRVSYLLEYNYEVLVFDYRNYGKSTGNFIEKDMYNDGLSVYNHLKNCFKEESIIVYGFSLGCTFATRIASENNPKELILEAPFYNFKKAAQYKSIFTPTFLLKYQFRTDKDIVDVNAPITIFHGDEDKTTCYKESKKLLVLKPSPKNRFIEIAGGTHHNIKGFAIYREKLKEILDR